ncbi:MAG: hypothetical protein AAFP81_12360 [Pseudomonadota bacterium]
MHGTHANAIVRLERELELMLEWRDEWVESGRAYQPRRAQIDLHRIWLETQISILKNPIVQVPA